jgi:hypothetical protein
MYFIVKNKIICMALILILLSSCMEKSEDPILIARLITITYIDSPDLSLGESVEIVLTNNTKHCIVFPLDDGILILAKQNEEWIEVENKISFIGNQDLILYPDGEIFSSRGLPLRPDTANLTINTPAEFIVQLRGYLCEDKNIVIQKEASFTIIP